MITGLQQGFLSYANQIPRNSLRTVGRSAVFSFTASVILVHLNPQAGVNLARPVVAGVTAALAATIHALLIPVFNYIFSSESTWYKELLIPAFSLTIAHVGLNYAIPSANINLINTLSPFKRFIILPSSIIKINLQILSRIQPSTTRLLTHLWGEDLNLMSTPIYFTA
ncbi:hypothetical protein [Candidatus Protochlamydia phocaeensis]|uniref:hypothetical protein n=1 Tax=Candidatus Protochlamydia phocaeensis TaxID=1414722 RepID=UPI00083901B0|nr:hypothetical protein [Candidatus Protochlamydia phocaeensis]